MWFELLLGLSAVAIIAYALLQLYFSIYFSFIPNQNSPEDYSSLQSTSLSIIVPFRNEEQGLNKCTNSLLKAAGKIEQVEVLLIDDHSTDDSTHIAKELAGKHNRIIYLKAVDEGKKQALAQAIEKSSSEWIFTADADCVYPQDSISDLMVTVLEDNLKVACLPVIVNGSSGMLHALQQIESYGLMMITAVALHDKLFYTASGAAMLYPKSLFQKLQPFRDNYHLSGDDQFLLYAYKSTNDKPVLFYKNRKKSVRTSAHAKWKEFFEQRLRWAGKNTHLKDFKLSGILSLTIAADVSVFLILILYITDHSILFGVILLLLIKLGSEAIALWISSRFWKDYNVLKYIPLIVIMHPFLHFILSILYVFKRRVFWKDRSVKVR